MTPCPTYINLILWLLLGVGAWGRREKNMLNLSASCHWCRLWEQIITNTEYESHPLWKLAIGDWIHKKLNPRISENELSYQWCPHQFSIFKIRIVMKFHCCSTSSLTMSFFSQFSAWAASHLLFLFGHSPASLPANSTLFLSPILQTVTGTNLFLTLRICSSRMSHSTFLNTDTSTCLPSKIN